jgi:hypothetical protein
MPAVIYHSRMVSHAGRGKSDRLDQKRHPGPPGWEIRHKVTASSLYNMSSVRRFWITALESNGPKYIQHGMNTEVRTGTWNVVTL